MVLVHQKSIHVHVYLEDVDTQSVVVILQMRLGTDVKEIVPQLVLFLKIDKLRCVCFFYCLVYLMRLSCCKKFCTHIWKPAMLLLL